jgi:hypothetical protein
MVLFEYQLWAKKKLSDLSKEKLYLQVKLTLHTGELLGHSLIRGHDKVTALL